MFLEVERTPLHLRPFNSWVWFHRELDCAKWPCSSRLPIIFYQARRLIEMFRDRVRDRDRGNDSLVHKLHTPS